MRGQNVHKRNNQSHRRNPSQNKGGTSFNPSTTIVAVDDGVETTINSEQPSSSYTPAIYAVPTTDTFGDEDDYYYNGHSSNNNNKNNSKSNISDSHNAANGMHKSITSKTDDQNNTDNQYSSGANKTPIHPVRSQPAPYSVQTPARYRKPITSTPNLSTSSSVANSVISTTRPPLSRSMTPNQRVQTQQTISLTGAEVHNSIANDSQSQNDRCASSKATNVLPYSHLDSMSTEVPAGTLRNANTNTGSNSHISTESLRIRQRSTNSLDNNNSSRSMKSSKSWSNTFQVEIDQMSVRLRTVNRRQRSAFATHTSNSTSLEGWDAHLARLTAQGVSNASSRMSPSRLHLALLQKLQKCILVRQLDFSPSVSRHVDALRPSELDKIENVEENIRDGRYHSIDPIKSAVLTLPRVPPILSNKKHRLPMRSDVGFSGASEDETRMKQKEILQESQWEEASPRLAVLVTSEDLGISLVDNEFSPSSEHIDWNGGGLLGMPWAGPDLMLALDRNAHHFGRETKNDRRRWIEASPTSVFAPSLGSTFSPSLGWRPRILNDRPFTLQYFLVSPLNIKIDFKVNEPLVCSLSLYRLPIQQSNSGGTRLYGKLSENFYFPAGSWQKSHSTERLKKYARSGTIDDKSLDDWLKRKHQGIFSCSREEVDSVFVVLQVYKATHKHFRETNTPNQKHGAIKSLASTKELSSKVNVEYNVNSASKAFQLLTPLCFGVTALVNKDSKQWPNGNSTNMSLYFVRSSTEPEDVFLERLCDVVRNEYNIGENPSRPLSDYNEETSSHNSGTSMTKVSDTSSLKKGLARRIFRSPRRNRQKSANKIDTGLPYHTKTELMKGQCALFVSSLGSDFIQALLEPPMHEDLKITDNLLPRCLVDTSGCQCITTKNGDISVHKKDAPIKRANLVRLSTPDLPCDYLSVADFQEVLYLPPKKPKHYDVQNSVFGPVCMNFLYVYPRLLCKAENARASDEISTFTIKVQVVTVVDPENMHLREPVDVLYTTCPWAGSVLDSEYYTRTVGNMSGSKKTPSLDTSTGVHMDDEVKISLPNILDCSQYLIFTLYSVDLSNNGECTLTLRSEAHLPLSTLKKHDEIAGKKTTTVVPNGLHRIKLGNYQLKFETRLVSSVHVVDPVAALSLQSTSSLEFGWRGGADYHNQKLSLAASSYGLLYASTSDVSGHFYVLMWRLLTPLFSDDRLSRQSLGISSQVRDNCLINLLILLQKVKSSINTQIGVEYLIKSVLDNFDEYSICHYDSESTNDAGTELLQNTTDDEVQNLEMYRSKDDRNNIADNNRHSVLRKKRQSLNKSSDERVLRVMSSLGGESLPFSRVAYGATKNDRMRAEAELRDGYEGNESYFEDDETIGIPATNSSVNLLAESRRQFEIQQSKFASEGPYLEKSSQTYLLSNDTFESSDEFRTQSDGNNDFTGRVRTVAQVMLAPCVGPALPSLLAGDNRRKAHNSNTNPRLGSMSFSVANLHHQNKNKFWSEETNEGDNSTHKETRGSKLQDTEGHIKGYPVLTSYSNNMKSTETAGIEKTGLSTYLYEMIINFWIDTWVQADISSQSSCQDKMVKTLFEHADFLLPLCLKSLIVRCNLSTRSASNASVPVLADEDHMLMFGPFVEILAEGLIKISLAGTQDAESRDASLLRSLSLSDQVLDFLIGLMSIVHSHQIHILVSRYFSKLQSPETDILSKTTDSQRFKWNDETLFQIRRSRQLRVRAIEVLATIPAYLSINYPPIFVGQVPKLKTNVPTWTHQTGVVQEDLSDYKHLTVLPRTELPPSGWLATMLTKELLAISALSSEAVVMEALAHIETTSSNGDNEGMRNKPSLPSALKKRPASLLNRKDLLMFQSLAIHSITVLYELLIRRHAMDMRFQSDKLRERIVTLIAPTILEGVITNVRWLARMEATHKVRSMWLLCFIYVLQEAPEEYVKSFIMSLVYDKDNRVNRFVRLLRLCTSTFQDFLDLPKHPTLPQDMDKGLSPWLLQEGFNTVCASTIVVIEMCATKLRNQTAELQKMMYGILDLLLHILTTPQSSVTHLRAMGALMKVLDECGVEMFLNTIGDNFQHWARVILALMNSTFLSVRSISVDFVISLFGASFDADGSIDNLTTVFATVLSEVSAREIALQSSSGHIKVFDDVCKCIWPLRRSFADLDDANPSDDDRVDVQLSPIISSFCRGCQAILDGVLIELRLRGSKLSILGSTIEFIESDVSLLDADEESVYEAANFFIPEIAPLQKVRWLLTLCNLHRSKQHWVEAAEALMLCAYTLSDAILHARNIWRPSKFALWSDSKRSMWLETVGDGSETSNGGNSEVMHFAESFLEPTQYLNITCVQSQTVNLNQNLALCFCDILVNAASSAKDYYMKDEGMNQIAYSRVEDLQKSVSNVVDGHNDLRKSHHRVRKMTSALRKRHAELEASLRKVLASLSRDLANLAETFTTRKDRSNSTDRQMVSIASRKDVPVQPLHSYVVLRLYGHKPSRFEEHTALPTFLEWDSPCICRVPNTIISAPTYDPNKATKKIALTFAMRFANFLKDSCHASVSLQTQIDRTGDLDPDVTYVQVIPVRPGRTELLTSGFMSGRRCKRFLYDLTSPETGFSSGYVEITVADTFPCALSRQRSLLITEYLSN